MGAGWKDIEGQKFTTPDGSLVHPESFSKVFDRRVAAWKCPHLTIHGLRHTWATVALSNGILPRVVQERFGHATVAVTLQTYSHVTPSLHDDAARKVATQLLAHGGGPRTPRTIVSGRSDVALHSREGRTSMPRFQVRRF